MDNKEYVTIYSSYRTLPDGTRRFASQDGLKAYKFDIPLEKHNEYLKKRNKRS